MRRRKRESKEEVDVVTQLRKVEEGKEEGEKLCRTKKGA